MLRFVLTIGCAAAAGSAAMGRGNQTAADVLAATRQALGGEAVLGGVTSFVVNGSLVRDLGAINVTSELEISCVLPDKFVQTTHRRTDMGPLGSGDYIEYAGFNGDDPIQETFSDSPIPPPVMAASRAPTTAADVAAERTTRTNGHKRRFVELTLPLFAASFPAFPLELTPVGRVPLDSGPADEVDARGPDGTTWRLFLDAGTHLPVKVTWMGRPIVVMSASSAVAVSSRGQVLSAPTPVVLPGDPTAGRADVQWTLTLGQYRSADGLTWPRVLTTTVDGSKHEEIRVSRFRINPKIDLKKFRPR
jgi:hypothetical protein